MRQVRENEADPKQKYPKSTLERNHVFFDGGSSSNHPIKPKLPSKVKKKTIVGRITDGHVHVLKDTQNGAIFRPDPDSDPVFVLLPRKESLEITGEHTSDFVESLHNLEKATNSNHTRGADKVVMHQTSGTKYCCAGERPNRGGCGVKSSVNVDKIEEKNWDCIVDYVIRCETAFTKWMDTNILRGIRHAKSLLGYKTLSRKKGSKLADATIFGALAFGRNVYLNAHLDADYCYSIVTGHRRLSDGENGYSVDDEVIHYFVFPRYGMAVPLRPGDILIFNPQEYHCISSRVSEEEDVYCCSLYLKSGVVGLNDNSIPLTQEQQKFADAYNKWKEQDK